MEQGGWTCVYTHICRGGWGACWVEWSQWLLVFDWEGGSLCMGAVCLCGCMCGRCLLLQQRLGVVLIVCFCRAPFFCLFFCASCMHTWLLLPWLVGCFVRCVNVVGGVVSVAGHQAVAEVLLQNGADPNAKNKMGSQL